MLLSSKIRSIFLLPAIAALLSLPPFQFYRIYPGIKMAVGMTSIVVMTVLICWHFLRFGFVRGNRLIILSSFAQIAYFLVLAVATGDDANVSIAINAIALAVVFYIYAATLIGTKNSLSFLYWLVWFLCAVSIIGFALAARGDIHPYSFFTLEDEREAANFMWFFSISYFGIGDKYYARVSSFFEEPGVFSLIIVHCLLLGYLLKMKNAQWSLAIAGLLSFSLAFLVGLWIYIIGFIKKFRFTGVALIVAGVMLLGLVTDENTGLGVAKNLVYDRFIGENREAVGLFAGDNRTSEIIMAWDVFKQAPMFGVGFTYARKNYPNFGSNIIAPFAYFGIIGFMFYFLHIFVFLYSGLRMFGIFTRNNGIAIAFLLMMSLQYFQRPQILGLFLHGLILLMSHYFLANGSKL